jgi:hypothetical protein
MKHIIQELCEVSINDKDCVRSYSCGVYNEGCLGVVVNDPNAFIFKLGIMLGEFRVSNVVDMKALDSNIPKHFIIETDNMGNDTIVYFPQIKYTE